MQIPPRQPTGFPTLLAHLASADFIHPLYVLPVKSSATSNGLSTVYRPLMSTLPCDVHVVNLRTMPLNGITTGFTPAPGSPQMALILHRVATDCSFPLLRSAASCPAAGGQVSTSVYQ